MDKNKNTDRYLKIIYFYLKDKYKLDNDYLYNIAKIILNNLDIEKKNLKESIQKIKELIPPIININEIIQIIEKEKIREKKIKKNNLNYENQETDIDFIKFHNNNNLKLLIYEELQTLLIESNKILELYRNSKISYNIIIKKLNKIESKLNKLIDKYYMLNQEEKQIINHIFETIQNNINLTLKTIEENQVLKENINSILQTLINDHFNFDPNMNGFKQSNIYNQRFFNEIINLRNNNNNKLLEDYKNEMLSKYKEALKKEGLGLVVIDLANFKKVNDTYGHDVGDLVLININKFLSELQLKYNIESIFRLGGDEYVVIGETSKIRKFIKELQGNVKNFIKINKPLISISKKDNIFTGIKYGVINTEIKYDKNKYKYLKIGNTFIRLNTNYSITKIIPEIIRQMFAEADNKLNKTANIQKEKIKEDLKNSINLIIYIRKEIEKKGEKRYNEIEKIIDDILNNLDKLKKEIENSLEKEEINKIIDRLDFSSR